ncbi:MAG TPA: HAMP domain-containing protein [Chloroflexia bacterium]|nr:HAMP domain-containing protein [Chloroflexia bacterium]
MTTQVKAVLVATLLLVAAVLVTAGALAAVSRQAVLDQLTGESQTFARQFALAIADQVPDHPLVVAGLARRVLAGNLPAVWITDRSLTLLAHATFPGAPVPTDLSAADTAQLAQAIHQQSSAVAPEGDFLHVAVPIVDDKGQTVGAALILVSTQPAQNLINQELLLAAAITGGVLVVGLLTVGVLARQILQPIGQIQAAVAAIEAQTFQPAILAAVAARTDEIGQLARLLQTMAQEVAAREQRLQQQVAELHIEINEARKAREVTDITDSSYFQDLQKKARAIRAKSAATGAAPAEGSAAG